MATPSTTNVKKPLAGSKSAARLRSPSVTRRAKTDLPLAKRIRRPKRSSAAPKPADADAADPPAEVSAAAALTPPRCRDVCASRCCRSESRDGRCLASISRDVRKTQCEVKAQGERIVADIDLLRAQLVARLERIETSLDALAGTPITARDVLTAPDGVFVISQPGHYTFAENIILPAPIGPFNLVIEIAANDVVLDLGSFVFEQQGSTAATALFGIFIAGPTGNGASNVTIQNGTIRGFSHAVAVAEGSDLTVLQRLRVLDIGVDESFFATMTETDAVFAFFVSNLIVRECVFDRVRGSGLFLASVQGLLVEDVLMTNFLPRRGTDSSGNILGVNLFEFPNSTVSNDITIRRTIFEDFVAAAPAGPPPPQVLVVAVGIFDPTIGIVGHNILIEDVLVRRLSASGGLECDSGGIEVTGNVEESAPEVRSDPVGNVFRRVVVQDLAVAPPATAGTNADSFGILAFCQQTLIEDCVVQNLVYTGTANPSKVSSLSLIGVHYRSDQGFAMRRCSVTGLDGTRFGRNANADIAAFETCVCGVLGGLLEQNYAGDNRADPSSEGAAGFAVNSAVDTVVRNNVAADNNFVGFVAADALVPSRNNLFQSNTVTGSATWGFADMTADSNNAYVDNFARSARFNYHGPQRYGAQIIQWSIPAPAPTANITKLTNLSVSP